MFQLNQAQREALFDASDEAFRLKFDDDALLEKMRTSFDESGYVLIRGLLDNAFMGNLEQASQKIVDDSEALASQSKESAPRSFTSLKFGPVFPNPSNKAGMTASNDESNTTNNQACEADSQEEYFRQVALDSAVPKFIAKVLLQLQETESLRVLKDAFLAKGKEENLCGWHVDDFAFWPTIAKDPSTGVNAWVAIDDIPSAFGGGMAVSPGSHKADEWRHDAYKAIGSTQIFPEDGFRDAQEMFNTAKVQTCTMDKTDSSLEAKIESTKVLPDYKQGDVLFCNRWLFHRSEKVNEAGMRHLEELKQSKHDGYVPVLKRYTIRYEMGSARFLKGYSLEPCLMVDPSLGGKTLDEVCSANGPWYPRCWPRPDNKELEDMKRIVEDELPKAEAIKAERLKVVRNFFFKPPDKAEETKGEVMQ